MQHYRPALLISSDPLHRESVTKAACQSGLHLLFSARLSDARELLASKRFAVIFCSDELPDSDLQSTVRSLRSAAPAVPVIVVSRLADWPACMEAMSAGAFDYIAWPPDHAEIDRVVQQALTQRASRLHSAA